MAQLTSQDLDNIRKQMEQASQPKVSNPIPTLATPKGKTFTDESLNSLRQNIKIYDQKVKEEKAKATNAPAKYGNKVPSKAEVRRKQIMEGRDPASVSMRNKQTKDLKNEDRRNLSREEEASLKKQIKEENQTKKKRIEDLNNIPRNVGDNNETRYNSRFSLDKTPTNTVGEKIAKTQRDRAVQANIVANKAANKISEQNKDILDDNTLAQMDARAKELQAIEARTTQENEELQSIYDRKESHDKAVEREKRLNGENHVVNNTRYNQLMSDNRLANDIDKLVDVIYNNANQDATVSDEWANTIGARNITGGLTKDQFIDEMSRRYDLTKEELLDIALTRKTEQYNAEIAQYNADLNRFAGKNALGGITGSLGSFIGTAGGVGEGAYNLLANAITGDDRYTSRMFNTTKEGLREGAKQNIDTNFMKGVYDIGMGVGDMGVGALMGSAPAVLAGNTANRTLINSVDKGIDPRQAALYAGLTGVTDYVTNKIGLDKAKDLAVKSIIDTGWKGALAKNAIAGLGEAGENVIQDVAQNMLDRIINGEDSELSTAYNNLIAQGYSEEDAFKEVAKQFGQQELMSAAQGYAMGSVMQGGKTLINNAIDVSNYLANKNSNGVVERANEFNERNKAVNEGLNEVPRVGEQPSILASLPMDLQFFANKKAEIEDALQNENLSVEERADLEGQLNEVNRKISQFATNSAINSGVVSQDTLDNDPFYKEAKMVTPTTEAATLDEAKGRIAEGNDTWVDAYNDGSKKIETATDVDTTMLGMRDLDNRIAEATDDATREQLQAKKNMLFAKAVQAVHNGGQFLQALKKWNRLSTDGVLLNAEKLAQDIVDDTYGRETGEKTSKNVKTRESSEIKEKSQKIINAIKKADGEDISKPVKKERSLEEVRQIVRNTFDGKLADRVKDFTDDDYNYVANLLKNGASTEDLSNAFKRRFATGKWGISDEARTQVNDLMNYAQSLDLNSRERVATEQKIFQILADEIYGKDSANFKEKFEAWRYLAMLGNPKTHVRNIIGNTLFQGVTGMSNTLAAKMEDIADKRSIRKTGHGIERTKAVLHLATDANDRALVKDSANDSDKTYGLWSGNKWNEDLRNNIESQKRIFKNNGVNAVNELNSNLLDAEDNMAMRSKYATSLAGYLKANGEDTSIFKVEDRIKTLENSKRSDPLKAKEYDAELENLYKRKEILDKGRERAIQSAKYSAFHEDNALADSLSKWSKDLKQKAEEGSKGAALMHYLIEGMLPFKKTPANILRSGVEYSPLNLVNDISKLRKYNKGYDNVELADVFDSMSKTLTGSAIMALGALMYDKGVLLSSTGDEKYQDQLEGKQNYSLRIGDYTATIDFAAPSVMPLLLGAEVMKSLKDDGLDFNDFVDAIESNDFSGAMEAAWEAGKNTLNAGTRIASPLVETSMLQGVNDTLEGISDAVKNGNAGDALSAVTGNLLTSYVTSGIPTLVGQVARATDNTRRSTTGGVKTLEKLQNKIPYLSTKNQPYIDAHGREQTNSPMNNILGRLAYQMFSPSYVAKVNETEGDKLAREVYNETKNPDVFSAWTGSKKIDGQKVSPEDNTKYMQTRGDADTRIRDMLAGDEWFRGLSKSDQEDILTGLKGLTDKIGEQEINPNFTSTSGELAAYNENPENLDSLLNYYKDKIHKGEVKNEMGTTSDFATSLYDSGDEKRINKYKVGTQIANEYGYDNLTEEEYLNYEKYGEAKLKKILNYKKTASELDVSNNEKFRKLLDSGISKESIKKASDAITSVENGKDEFGRQKYLSLNDTTYDIYKKDGTAGLRTYSKLTQANTDYDLYKQAKKTFKNLNEDSYIKMFKSLDGSAGSKADGDISQKELLRLFNTRNMTQQQVNAYWKAYGKITGKDAWKSIPELKYNKKTNTYEWKAVSKK